jgi:hypothetical protein
MHILAYECKYSSSRCNQFLAAGEQLQMWPYYIMLKATSLPYSDKCLNCYSCCPAILYVLCKCVIFLDDCSLFLLLWMALPSTDLYDSSTIERLYWSPVVFDCLAILIHEAPEFFNLWS